MFPAAGKGERRSLRGSARLSSKMSGRLPRLRALRPRAQPQRRARAEPVAVDATTTPPRAEGNLKGAAASHEVEHDAKRDDAKKGEDAAAAVREACEMDEDDNDDEVTMTAVDVDEEEDEDEEERQEREEEDEEETMMLDGDVDIDVDVDVDVAVTAYETIDLEAGERASCECKTCEPPKTLPSIKAYFEHLQKEHEYKVSTLPLLLPDFFLEFALLRVLTLSLSLVICLRKVYLPLSLFLSFCFCLFLLPPFEHGRF